MIVSRSKLDAKPETEGTSGPMDMENDNDSSEPSAAASGDVVSAPRSDETPAAEKVSLCGSQIIRIASLGMKQFFFLASIKSGCYHTYGNLFIRTNECTQETGGTQEQGASSHSEAEAEADFRAAAFGPHSLMGTSTFLTVYGSNLPRRVPFFLVSKIIVD